MGRSWTTWIALLRGVNVGGANIVKMADLRALLEAEGYRSVSTLLQSGNVVLEAATASADKLRKALGDAMERRFGFRVDIMLRTAAELDQVIEENPFIGRDLAEIKWLAVMFCEEDVEQRFRAFAEAYEGPEELVPRGRELYVYYTTGMGRSKLPQAMAPLKISGTVRNWNTLNKLSAAANRGA